MKKRIGIISLFILSLTLVSFLYLSSFGVQKEDHSLSLKTVVFKDQDDELIPISINFHSQVELEQEVRNRIELMQSHELERYGLYPVINSELKVLSVQLHNQILTLNINDKLTSYDNDLDVLEALTYVLTDYDHVHQLKLQINGKDISFLPNRHIPVSSLTEDLGLNNFIETSSLLHETIPIMVYNEKIINQYSYYIPTTMRLNENFSIEQQVQSILKYVQTRIQVLDVELEDGILQVELGSNILLDNEKIDQTLEELIVLSLSSLKDVKDVNILVNKENVRTKKSSLIQYNYIKI